MFSRFALLLLALVLSACSSVPQKEIVTVTKYEYITIDESLLQPCLPDRPIDKDTYLSLSIDQRESELTKYIIHLLSVNQQCNIQISNIRKLNNSFKEQNTNITVDTKQKSN